MIFRCYVAGAFGGLGLGLLLVEPILGVVFMIMSLAGIVVTTLANY